MAEISGAWKPTVNGETKKLANDCEVTHLKLSAGGGAAVVSIFDGSSSTDTNEADLKWVLDASTTAVDSDKFDDGLVFKKGVIARLDQGGGFSPIVLIAKKHYEV